MNQLKLYQAGQIDIIDLASAAVDVHYIVNKDLTYHGVVLQYLDGTINTTDPMTADAATREALDQVYRTMWTRRTNQFK